MSALDLIKTTKSLNAQALIWRLCHDYYVDDDDDDPDDGGDDGDDPDGGGDDIHWLREWLVVMPPRGDNASWRLINTFLSSSWPSKIRIMI